MKTIGSTLLPAGGRLPRNKGVRRLACVFAAGLLVTLGCREDTTSPTAPETTPALSTASTPLSFIQVSGGGRHSCGISTDNRAYCWGSNDFRQLGSGSAAQPAGPVAVAGGLSFNSVTAGSGHTCGVTVEGSAFARSSLTRWPAWSAMRMM